MAGMSAVNMLKKGSEFQWTTDTYTWQDDAACAFRGAGLFMYNDRKSQDWNRARGLEAIKICNTCPVKQQCNDDAEENSDGQWTIRGGKQFGQLNLTPPKTRTKNPGVRRDVECHVGHNRWAYRETQGHWRCLDCHWAGNQGRPKVGPSKKRFANDPTKPCVNGHPLEEWRKRKESVNGYYCLGCSRERKGNKKNEPKDFTKPCPKGHDASNWKFRVNGGSAYCGECKRIYDREAARRKSGTVGE